MAGSHLDRGADSGSSTVNGIAGVGISPLKPHTTHLTSMDSHTTPGSAENNSSSNHYAAMASHDIDDMSDDDGDMTMGAMHLPEELAKFFTTLDVTPRAFDVWASLLAAAEQTVCVGCCIWQV